MDVTTALTREIGLLPQPVITSYQVALILFRLYQERAYKGEPIKRLMRDTPAKNDFNRQIKKLAGLGILQESEAAKHAEIFAIIGKDQTSAEEIACCIDPFCYVSHMSAMEWHGFTNRVPKMLFISSPSPTEWQSFARERMLKDLGEGWLAAFRVGSLPTLRRLTVETIARKKVHRHASRHLGAFTSVRDKALRVSTIGRTFLDMLQEPDLCGGIYHVLDVWQEHAARNLPLIVGEVDQHGSKIDKVRVGYILEERLGLKHPSLENWVTFAQRGGSRKLYANASYSERFSEKWCLSLNIEEAADLDQYQSMDQP